MKRRIKIMLTVISVMLMLGVETASAQMSDLKFGNYGVEKIRIKSLRSGTGLAWVMTENSGKSFYMSDIKGTVYKNGKPFVTGTCKPVKVVAGEFIMTLSSCIEAKKVVYSHCYICDNNSLVHPIVKN